MAKKATVRFFASRNAYYCQMNGKQIKLGDGPNDEPHGPNYLAAFDQWRSLIALQHADAVGDGNTLRVIGEMYLRHIETRTSKNTLAMRLYSWRSFTAQFGERQVSALTKFAVEAWADGLRNVRNGERVSASTVRCVLTSIKAGLSWARQSGLIKSHPLERLPLPAIRSRGAEAVLSDEQRERVLVSVSGPVRSLVAVLDATGCRPGEVVAMEARYFNPVRGTITFLTIASKGEKDFAHKNARKGKTRTIYLSGEALEIVRAAASAHPSGALLRDKKGNSWKSRQICATFEQLRKRLSIPHLIPYSFRHTFATRWILSGRSVDVLAEVMGNSPDVIRQHYSHLDANADALQTAALDFARERELETLALGDDDVSPCVIVRT